MNKRSSRLLKLIFLLILLLIAGAGYNMYQQTHSLQGRLQYIGKLVDTSYQLKLNTDVDLDYIYKPEALTEIDKLLTKYPELHALELRLDALKLATVKRQYQPWTHMAEYAINLITQVNPDLDAILLPRPYTPTQILSPAANTQVNALRNNEFPPELAMAWAYAPFHFVEQDAASAYFAAISQPDVKADRLIPWEPGNPYYQAPPKDFDQTLLVLSILPFERIFGALPIETYKNENRDKTAPKQASLTKQDEAAENENNSQSKQGKPEKVITFVKPSGTTELYSIHGGRREILDIIIQYELVTLPLSDLKKEESERKYQTLPGTTYSISAIQNFIYNQNLFRADLYQLRSLKLDPERKINPWEPGNSIPRICLPPSP